jgi:hypothetical protein
MEMEMLIAMALGATLGAMIDPSILVPCVLLGMMIRQLSHAVLFALGWRVAVFLLVQSIYPDHDRSSGREALMFFGGLAAALLSVGIGRFIRRATSRNERPIASNSNEAIQPDVRPEEVSNDSGPNPSTDTHSENVEESPEPSPTRESQTAQLVTAVVASVVLSGALAGAIGHSIGSDETDRIRRELYVVQSTLDAQTKREQQHLAHHNFIALHDGKVPLPSSPDIKSELQSIAIDFGSMPNHYVLDSRYIANHQGCVAEIAQLQKYVTAVEAKRASALGRIRTLVKSLE